MARDAGADTWGMETRVFRILFWQRCIPLLALPAFGGFVAISPLTSGWSSTAWLAILAAVAGGVAFYLANVWRTSAVTLDEEGLTVPLPGGAKTFAYEKLLKYKQTGRYRVRLCFDPGVADKHEHVTFDLFDSDGFVDELLDRYEITTGHELAEPEEHAAAA